MSPQHADTVLDTKGLHCPMPMLKAKKALDSMQTGQVLQVISDDAGTKTDIPALVSKTGHALVAMKESEGLYEFLIRKQ